MWAAIGTLLTTLLPVLVKLIWYIVEKKQSNDQLKIDILKLIDTLSSENIPVKLHDKYQDQIKRINEQLAKESGDVQP